MKEDVFFYPNKRLEFFSSEVYFFFMGSSMKGFESHVLRWIQGKKLAEKRGKVGSKKGVNELMILVKLNDYKLKINKLLKCKKIKQYCYVSKGHLILQSLIDANSWWF